MELKETVDVAGLLFRALSFLFQFEKCFAVKECRAHLNSPAPLENRLSVHHQVLSVVVSALIAVRKLMIH